MSGRKSEIADAPHSRFSLPEKSTGVLTRAEREIALELARSLLCAPTAPCFVDGPIVALLVECSHSIGTDPAGAKMQARLMRSWQREYKRRIAFSVRLDGGRVARNVRSKPRVRSGENA